MSWYNNTLTSPEEDTTMDITVPVPIFKEKKRKLLTIHPGRCGESPTEASGFLAKQGLSPWT